MWNSPRCSVLLFAQWGFIRSTSSLFYANKPHILAKVVGIEPTSQGFGDLRITVFPHRLINLERATGIEPVSSAWKASVIPLYQVRFILVPPRRLERRTPSLQVMCSTN